MTEQEDARRKPGRDLLLVLLILPFGVLCMFMTGQVAIRLAPTWVLEADMRSLLDPNTQFDAGGIPVYIEPLDPGILTLPAWGDLFLTPNAAIPTRLVPTPTLLPLRTPPPPPQPTLPREEPEPTATLPGPIVFPTPSGPAKADLAIEISDNNATYTPGTPIHYTIKVTNRGPDSAFRFNVIDEVPAVISGLTINCAPANFCGTNTSSGNRISFTGASLPATIGANQITISISGTVASSATGQLSNTAEIVVPGGSRFEDPVLSNNTATDSNRQYSVYDLAITKTDGGNMYTATAPVIYQIVVTNSGPSDALGITIRDNLPPQIASWTWTCITVTNPTCNGGSSSSNFVDTVDIVSGGRLEYRVVTNPAGIPQELSNTATVNIPTGTRYNDPNLSNNSATDTNTPYIDLQITKDDGASFFTPPGPVSYTITVTNKSTFNLTGIAISDPKPAQVTTWSWSCPGGCTPVVDSNSNFTDTISLAAGGSLFYTVTANLSGAAGVSSLSNTVTVSPPAGLVDAVPADNSATDVDSPYVDLQITKTDGTTAYAPGLLLQYIVTVTNNSGFPLNGANVTDNIPALIDPSSWNWICAPLASCTVPSGTGSINTTVNLAAGAVVTFTIDATVSATASGDLSNMATVSPPAGIVDSVPGNNTAVDTNTRQEEYIFPLGPPDDNILFVAAGSSIDFTLTTPIMIDGNTSDYEIVFYEWEQQSRNEIDLDQIIISIGDGTAWYVVYYWGDDRIDTNTSPPGALSEPDNYRISTSLLYGSPYQTGILIDADGGKERPPNGTYQYIRVTAPGPPGDTDGGCDIDSIGIWP